MKSSIGSKEREYEPNQKGIYKRREIWFGKNDDNRIPEEEDDFLTSSLEPSAEAWRSTGSSDLIRVVKQQGGTVSDFGWYSLPSKYSTVSQWIASTP